MGKRAIIAGGGTGGHLYPALNLAEALGRTSGGRVEVMLVGARRGVESRVFPERGVMHRLLPLEPIYRRRPWRNWRLVPSAIRSGLEIQRTFAGFAPNLVVGTGGYAAGPVVAWALARGLRTAVQEQNSYPGLTTRWLAPYVDQLHLGYEEALRHLRPGPETQVRAHGNPIRWPERRPEPEAARREFGLGAGRVVLVVGGSQGSAALNAGLLQALAATRKGELSPLPSDVELLWSTGPAHHDEVVRRLAGLGDTARVQVLPYIAEMEKALSLTTLAVSRAGALALSELCAWGVPAILVPYPHAAADHQRRNAWTLEAAGAAVVFEQAQLESEPAALWRTLLATLADPKRLGAMKAAAGARGNSEAAAEIAADLLELMRGR